MSIFCNNAIQDGAKWHCIKTEESCKYNLPDKSKCEVVKSIEDSVEPNKRKKGGGEDDG